MKRKERKITPSKDVQTTINLEFDTKGSEPRKKIGDTDTIKEAKREIV